MTKVTCKKRQRLKRKIVKIRRKIKNKVKDLHWKTADFYCKNYKTIIIPKLNTKSLIKLNKGKQKCLIRTLLNLSHSEFIERLKSKAREYKNQVLIVTEEYTSKTCGQCGMLHNKLGSSKIYKCGNCKTIIDRYINGAINILIKTLSEIK